MRTSALMVTRDRISIWRVTCDARCSLWATARFYPLLEWRRFPCVSHTNTGTVPVVVVLGLIGDADGPLRTQGSCDAYSDTSTLRE